MIPGDVVSFTLRRQTIAGAVSAGKVLADFTIGAYQNGATASVSPAITEIGASGSWTAYKIDVTIPAGEGVLHLTYQAKSGTDVITPASHTIEIESYDLRSAVAIFAVPIVSVVNQGGPQGDIAIRLVKDTYAPITFTARDQSGTAIDLSTWTIGTFAIRSQNQTTTVYSLTAGITMSAAGLVTIPIPEAAGFYAALAAGVDEASLFWTFVANDSGDAAKTRCLARGRLTVLRTEV